MNDGEDDDSQVELPAFPSDDDPSSDEIAVLAEDQPSAEILIADSRHSHFTDTWVRHRFAGTLIAGALALAILGFFVRQAILNSQAVSSWITALIAGCIGLGGLLLLLLSMTRNPLHVLLGEPAKNLRRPSPRPDIGGQIASE